MQQLRFRLRQLNGILAEINVILFAIAIGLAVLDLACFVMLQTCVEIAREHAKAYLTESGLNMPRDRGAIASATR